MPNLDWNRRMWTEDSTWTTAGEEWSGDWGDSEAQWFGSLYPRLHRLLPAETILEIAPGFGRWTRFLLPQCGHYIGMDLSASCVDACRNRFAGYPHARFIQNDGLSLPDVSEGSIDLVFSYDSLVHCEIEVLQQYIPQIIEKLAAGGLAFIHHSNLLAITGDPKASSAHHRAGSVSAQRVAALVAESSGKVLLQESLSWGTETMDDCITVFGKAAAFPGCEPMTLENPWFMTEAAMIKGFQYPYSSHLARCITGAVRKRPPDRD
jgi:SAM-dependent methyltransferase